METFELLVPLIPLEMPVSRSPFLTLEDLRVTHCGTFAEPVLGFDSLWQRPSPQSAQEVVLDARPGPRDGDLLQTRTIADQGISITTSFYWPSPPRGPVAGYTAPLIRWVETSIQGIARSRSC